MVSLGGTDLSVFEWFPGKHSGSNIYLKGHLDNPSRLGKTFHEWPGREGIQPYVAASEIRLGGRDIYLTGYILADTDLECKNHLSALYSLIDGFTGLVPLITDFGVFQVYVKDTISPEYITDQGLKITIVFREPMPDLSGIMPESDEAQYGISDISFSALGGFLIEIAGEVRNRPSTKQPQFTSYSKEGYQVTKTQARELNIKLFIEQPDYSAFQDKIKGLYALLNAPGLRRLKAVNDISISFFIKDGFEVHTLHDQGSSFAGLVEFKLVQTGVLMDVPGLVIKGSLVSINGSIVQIKVGTAPPVELADLKVNGSTVIIQNNRIQIKTIKEI